MNYVITMCVSLILFSLLFLIIQKCNKKNESKMTSDDFVVKYPKAAPIILICCATFFLVVTILMSTILYNEENSLLTYILCYIFYNFKFDWILGYDNRKSYC